MGKSVLLYVIALVALASLVAGETIRITAEGFDVGRPVETACFESDISFQDTTDHMYVGVPTSLFELPNRMNTCGQKLQVSCDGRIGDDNSHPCKSNQPVMLTIIDTLDGDFIEISNKAFNIISDFNIGVIPVKVVT